MKSQETKRWFSDNKHKRLVVALQENNTAVISDPLIALF